MFSRKAKDYGVCVIINTVFERMDGMQKQLHKGKWIQSAKRGVMTEKNKQNICFHNKPFKMANEDKKDKKEEEKNERTDSSRSYTYYNVCNEMFDFSASAKDCVPMSPILLSPRLKEETR